MHPGTEQPDITKTFEPTVLTRKSDPHNPVRVKTILSEITVGQDLTPAQRESIKLLIAEFAECFALSMSEVTAVKGASLKLDIPRDKQFRTKINQRPQSPPQKEFFNEVINKMLQADIIRPIAPRCQMLCSHYSGKENARRRRCSPRHAEASYKQRVHRCGISISVRISATERGTQLTHDNASHTEQMAGLPKLC